MLAENISCKGVEYPNMEPNLFLFKKKSSFTYAVLYFEDIPLANDLKVISPTKKIIR